MKKTLFFLAVGIFLFSNRAVAQEDEKQLLSFLKNKLPEMVSNSDIDSRLGADGPLLMNANSIRITSNLFLSLGFTISDLIHGGHHKPRYAKFKIRDQQNKEFDVYAIVYISDNELETFDDPAGIKEVFINPQTKQPYVIKISQNPFTTQYVSQL